MFGRGGGDFQSSGASRSKFAIQQSWGTRNFYSTPRQLHTRGVRWRDFLPSRSLYSPPRPLILYYCTMVGGGGTSLLVQSPPPFTLILVRVLATMVFIPRRSSSSASLATLEVPLVNNAVMREKCRVSRSAIQICWSS